MQREPGAGMTISGWTIAALASALSAKRLLPATALLQTALASAVCGLLVAWLVHRRYLRWQRIAMENAHLTDSPPHAPAEILDNTAPQPQPETGPVRAEQVQGSDLAARARFVAMSFAVPETSSAPHPPRGWPLHICCHPTRFTLSLRHAALRYRVQFCNRGAEPLGPLIIRADLVAVETCIPQSRQIAFEPDALPLCHYVDSLPAGSSVELSGEIRLPIFRIAAMRLGSAELLVPLIRLCAESAGELQPRLSVSACFAIGMPTEWAGGGIQPFRLDSGPGIWRKLAARRMIPSDLS